MNHEENQRKPKNEITEMAMKTIVQKNNAPQLSSITLMLEYEIDNTLNTIKENSHFMSKTAPHFTDKLKSETKPDSNTNQEVNNNSLQDSGSANLQTSARKRWKLLAKVLRKNSDELFVDEDEERMASVRRFRSFDLLRQDSLKENVELDMLSKPENWYSYRIELESGKYSVNIHHIDRHLTAEDLMGFNNTGNICVWPSEEALTVYALSDLQRFRGKWILELGGGMTALCGLVLAKYSRPYAVHLTDGNSLSVENVRRSICLNELSCYTKCSVLKWEESASRSNSEFQKFDYILSADCLFFDDGRSALVDTIWFYLSNNGTALLMAPRRGKTLSKFVEECERKGLSSTIVQRYNDVIWQRHLDLKKCSLYDEDIHYPILIILKKTEEFQFNNVN